MSIPENGMRTFFTIWVGQAVSTLGSGLTGFGIGIWVFQQTHSVTSFSFAVLSSMLPMVLFSPVAGMLVDRWDRKKALIVSNVGSGVASLLLAVLVIFGKLALWHICALLFVSSAFGTLMWPAFGAVMSLLVPKQHLGRANGLYQGAEALSMVGAPMMGAAMMALFGLQALLIADVVSFLVAIFTIAIVVIPRPPVSEIGRKAKKSFWGEVSFGMHFIRERPSLLGLLCFFVAINFVAGLIQACFTPLFLTLYNKYTLGLVSMAMGIGMLIGTAVMAAWGGPKKRIQGVLWFGGLGCGMLGLLSAPPNPVLYGAAGFLCLGLMPVVNGSSQAIWQCKTPPDVQGRVFATRRMIATAASPISILASGPLVDRVLTPGMMPGGSLTHVFGFIGTGPSAGIRLLFLLTAIANVTLAFVFYAIPRVRNVETDLPDYLPEAKPATPANMVPEPASA